MTFRAAAALLSLGLLAAACGGGSGAGAELPRVVATSLTTAATAATTVPTTAEPASAPAPPVDDFGSVTVAGDALPPRGDPAQADSAIGMPIPTVEGHDFAGTPVSIRPDGRAKILAFLAHWCPHCQNELPSVSAWLSATELPQGVEVIAIATLTRSDRPNYPPGTWFEREAWPGPVIVDDTFDTAARAFGLEAVPYWVITDAGGVVVARGTGNVPPEVLDDIVASIAP